MVDRSEVERAETNATAEGEKVAQIIPPEISPGQHTGKHPQNDRDEGKAEEHGKDGNDGGVLPDGLVAEVGGDVLGGFEGGLASLQHLVHGRCSLRDSLIVQAPWIHAAERSLIS